MIIQSELWGVIGKVGKIITYPVRVTADILKTLNGRVATIAAHKTV